MLLLNKDIISAMLPQLSRLDKEMVLCAISIGSPKLKIKARRYKIAKLAASSGSLAWFKRKQVLCPFVLNLAIKNGHADIVKVMVKANCEISKHAWSIAAQYNRLQILKYLHSNSFACLKISHCKYDASQLTDARFRALENGNQEILKFINAASAKEKKYYSKNLED